MSTRIQLLLAADYNDLGESLQREIYYEFYQMMYGFIVYIVKDRSAAEDIIQEAFIKIIKNKPEFENEIKLKAWLKVVTKNTAINYLRKNKKYRNLLDADSVFLDVETVQQNSVSIESMVETKLMQESIERYMETLKPEYKSLIELRWKEGLSYREMAELLDLREDVIKQRLFRAREAIKKLLYREWGAANEQRKVR